jgi:IS5 family transposase
MQPSFTDLEYAGRRRVTRREEFLDMMDEIMPWDEWVDIIKPYYYKSKMGRPPRGIETMLRMYLLQHWFTLSDEAVEEAIYDSFAFRKFMKLDFTSEQTPDATTLCKFRKVIVQNNISSSLFNAITAFFEENGYIMRGGTIVDATIIEAPSSTKNATGERDAEMRQTKKGNQWHFGMKIHAGVDAGTGYTHTITATAASVHDIAETVNLIREDDCVVWGDSGYLGIQNRPEILEDEHMRTIEYRINRRPSQITKTYGEGPGRDFEKMLERKKSSVRSKVEHPFHVIKQIFGYKKCPYKGLEKNLASFHILFASVNLYMFGRARILERKLRLQT